MCKLLISTVHEKRLTWDKPQKHRLNVLFRVWECMHWFSGEKQSQISEKQSQTVLKKNTC